MKVYIETFGKIYSIKIDSVSYESDFILSQNFREELGFETYINLDSIPSGKHLLKVNRMRIRGNDTTYWVVDHIPFWHFKN